MWMPVCDQCGCAFARETDDVRLHAWACSSLLLSTEAANMSSPYRILALHGKGETGESFTERLSAMSQVMLISAHCVPGCNSGTGSGHCYCLASSSMVEAFCTPDHHPSPPLSRVERRSTGSVA